MKKILFATFASILLFAASAIAEESIKIMSPANHAVIKGKDVNIKFDFVTAGEIDHVHLYVNGEMKKAVVGKKEVSIALPKGDHNLELIGATKDHTMLKTKAEVMVKVE